MPIPRDFTVPEPYLLSLSNLKIFLSYFFFKLYNLLYICYDSQYSKYHIIKIKEHSNKYNKKSAIEQVFSRLVAFVQHTEEQKKTFKLSIIPPSL